VKILPECKYNYIMHPGESLISTFYKDKPLVCMEADRQVQALCRQLGCGEAADADCRYMFAKSIFSCMTMLYSTGCPLRRRERAEYIRRMINEPQVYQRCRRVFGGLVPNLLCSVVSSRQVWLNAAVFRLLTLTGRVCPNLFTSLKHRK